MAIPKYAAQMYVRASVDDVADIFLCAQEPSLQSKIIDELVVLEGSENNSPVRSIRVLDTITHFPLLREKRLVLESASPKDNVTRMRYLLSHSCEQTLPRSTFNHIRQPYFLREIHTRYSILPPFHNGQLLIDSVDQLEEASQKLNMSTLGLPPQMPLAERERVRNYLLGSCIVGTFRRPQTLIHYFGARARNTSLAAYLRNPNMYFGQIFEDAALNCIHRLWAKQIADPLLYPRVEDVVENQVEQSH